MRNNSVRRFLVLVLVILVVLLSACTSVNGRLVDVISKELMCPCGECINVLDVCTCSTAEELTALIEKKLSQDQSKEQIIQYFIDQYGEQVLVEPTNP